jgi:hypothetical protein
MDIQKIVSDLKENGFKVAESVKDSQNERVLILTSSVPTLLKVNARGYKHVVKVVVHYIDTKIVMYSDKWKKDELIGEVFGDKVIGFYVNPEETTSLATGKEKKHKGNPEGLHKAHEAIAEKNKKKVEEIREKLVKLGLGKTEHEDVFIKDFKEYSIMGMIKKTEKTGSPHPSFVIEYGKKLSDDKMDEIYDRWSAKVDKVFTGKPSIRDEYRE